MSLINDALKRARQNQDRAPAPHIPGPPAERPEALSSAPDGRTGLFGTVGLITVVLAAFGLLWLSLRGGPDELSTVQARTQDVAEAPDREPQPAEAPPVAPVAPVPLAQPALAATVQSPATPTTDSQVAVPQPAAAPAPLRLQAVVFNPRRPSAIINGRTLFIGDRIEELRVVSITADSVTLAGGGVTNRLRLAQ